MKKRLLAILISFSVVAGSVYVPPGADAAAKVKLNKTKLNLTVGKTYKLKVKNFSGKVKWKSNKKKVAKVSKKGKVKAIKKGTAKIWAILPNKKLKCTVKVKPKKKITQTPYNETSAPYITDNPIYTNDPQKTQVPTDNPMKPTNEPTEKPTQAPTGEPTEAPTQAPTNEPTQAPTNKPTEKPTQAPTSKPTQKPTQAPTSKPTQKPTQAPTNKPTEKPTQASTQKPTQAPTNEPTKAPTAAPTNEPSKVPTAAPTNVPTPKPTPVPTTRPSVIESGDYSYASDYTLGYQWGLVAYKNSQKMSLADAGVTVYDKAGDRPFKAETEQAWDTRDLTLTQPVKYTTEDGVSHDIESMLTNFNFIADPAAIDNSDVDGKLYVYGTTEGFTYKDGVMADNVYDNHSLTILSTEDMVNWTDEGFMDTQNLTNKPSYSADKVKGGFSSGCAWAPSGLKIDGDGDGEDEYYIFYTNGGATGYVMADSPVGPWRDPLGRALFEGSTPNCGDCAVCFDPAVLVDDKGDAYVYFGGLSVTSGRACKIKFEPGTGYVLRDGAPVKLPTYYMFEDNEINQFNGLYYYSYCSNFDGKQTLTGTASICVYVSSDPLNVSFDPTTRPKGEEKTAFTDDNGVYRHFLGTVLDNPSSIYGQAYNNHHHMQPFKNHTYIFYHSTVLNNTIHRSSHSYRNLHVDEIEIDKKTDNINCTPSYEGAKQIESFNPYVDSSGNIKEINATTTSYSAGVCSRRSDSRVRDGLSPMVLDEIDTGDWTKIQGVDFGTVGASTFMATVASETDDAAIELYIDNPLSADNKVATIMVNNTGSQDKFEAIGTKLDNPITGVHDVYFVFRGTGYDVASWKFESNMEYVSPFDTITGITSGDNKIEDYNIKYENGVYNIYITGKNVEPGRQFKVSTVNGKTPTIIYNEFTGYTNRMGTVCVDMGNYKYTYYMYYWCSANPKPTPAPTPKPATPAPKPTPTPEPTPPPEMLDHYSAPYTLVFGSDTVATQGNSSYKLNDDGTVTIQVSGQYSGIAFVLPEDLEENNFDTVTITYKDAKDVGDGYGCGLWRTGEDKDSEDVVAWSGLFKNVSGEYKASIAGRDSTKAWYVNKCLLFNNTGNDVLSAASATVTITSVVFSHSKYGESGETPKPADTPKPTATPVPTATPKPTPTPVPTATPTPTPPPEMLDHYSAPYSLVFGSDTVVPQGQSSYKLNDDGTVTIQVSGQYSGISFVLPEDVEENNFDTVTITYKDAKDVGDGYGCGLWRTGDDKESEDVVAWGGLFKDASGEYKASIAGRDSTKAWYVNKCLLFNNTGNNALSAAPATVTITSVVFSHSKFLAEPPEQSLADKATIVQDVPSDFKDMKEGVEYGEFKSISYYSDITKSKRSANVVLPPGYDESKEYPVVYMLHGIGCTKEMFGTSIDNSSIAKIFGNLRAEGKCEDMIIVFPGLRVSDEPENNTFSLENYKHYDDFREDLINNLMPYMEEHFSVKTGRENTGVCGWSMGGREALYIGLSKPEMFGYVAGYCPAFGLLPYSNNNVSEEGLLAVKGAKEDTITLPEEYMNNTFVMICHGVWDNVVNGEPTRYHNALTTGGVPHIYKEYYSGHSDGVYDPGFYNFILNAFKLIKTDEGGGDTPDINAPYNVSISKDNCTNVNLVENVVNSEDGVSFDAKQQWGNGGGMEFWPAGEGKPFNLSKYEKMIIEFTAEDASVPMLLEMRGAGSENMQLSDSWLNTSQTAGGKNVLEYDLNKIQGEDREGDLYGIILRLRGWECDANKLYNIKVHSITFIPSEPIPELTSLKSVVEPVFGHIGTCINSWQLKQIKTVKYVAENYTSISLENEMKPDAILRGPISTGDARENTGDYVIPDNYTEETVPKLNFETVDEVLRIAKERGLKLRAHTLVWHGQTPEFFFREGYNKNAAYVNEETMNARLEMYIRSVMHHVYTLDDGAYKDVVYTWDVANEYMHNDADANWSAVYGNRSTKLKNKPGYIKLAFRIAHDCLKEYGIADKVSLVYNDFNTYFDCRENIIEMINYFNAEEKICDGVGMQSHLGVNFPSVEGYLYTVEEFIKAGFDVQITELDIGIDKEKRDPYEVQAEYVKKLMEGLLDIQDRTHKIKGITWWGLCDTSSWRGENEPLLFGKTMYDAKPAYYSFINAFNKE